MTEKKELLFEEKTYYAYGITNETTDQKQIFMMDIDRKIKPMSKLWIDLKSLQLTFDLSNIYVMESQHGYNIITFDKMTFEEIKKIGSQFSYADQQYYEIGIKRGHLGLKINKSKKLLYVICNKGKYEKSYAHRNFIEWFFDIIIKLDNQFDKNTGIYLLKYMTRKNDGYVEEIKEEFI